MTAPLLVLGAWLVFAGSHLALGLPPLRDRLARRLGQQRFVALFSAVAAIGLALLATVIALVGGTGAAGPALGGFAPTRITLSIVMLLGLTLAVAGVLHYPRSPMALFRTRLRPPCGIERITRHGFFVGLTLFALAHALLAPTLALCIYFAGFARLAAAGLLLQDRKLLARYGDSYRLYKANTSIIPFAALLRGRQQLSGEDRLARRLAVSAAVALALLAAHPLWSAFYGAPFAGIMAAGGVYLSARRWRYATADTTAPDTAD